ncbi:MAG TPA: FixH family protein [Terriglobia bacterium]|nr:FixH family protein [Terriglobia bacterium]
MSNSSKAVSVILQFLVMTAFGCAPNDTALAPPTHDEAEPIARTEFTDRIENFFEYEPLIAGKPSQFRIHLTDLTDGSPVEKAEVSLTVRRPGEAASVVETLAKIGKVTGIYVADLAIPQPGEYDIEFHIRNTKLDERLALSDFKVE